MLTGDKPFYSDYKHPHALLYVLGKMDISLDKFIHGEGFSIETQEFLGYWLNGELTQELYEVNGSDKTNKSFLKNMDGFKNLNWVVVDVYM